MVVIFLVVPVYPGAHLAACAHVVGTPLGCPSCTIGWGWSCIGHHSIHYDGSRRRDRSHRGDGNYHSGDSHCLDGSHPLSDSHNLADSPRRDRSRLPNRGCRPDTYHGVVAYRFPCKLADCLSGVGLVVVRSAEMARYSC